mgnify:CR=1 FL=1
MKSFMASPATIERKWYVVDATGYTLGRLSSEIAKIIYKVSGYESSDFKFIILPGETQTKNAQKVWVMNPVEAQKIIAMTMEQDS